MRIERALAIRAAALVRLRDLYSHATLFGLSASEITKGLAAIRSDYPRTTPVWVWNYVEGYQQALRDSLYRDHLIFGGFVDGVFYSTHRDRSDYYATNGIDPVDYANDGRVKDRGHYWKESTPVKGGTYNRGLKPYFVT